MKEKKHKLRWHQTRKVRLSLQRIWKFLGYFFTILGSVVLLYILSTYLLSRIPVKGQHNKHGEIQIYLMKSGVHTDFILPVNNSIKDWRIDFPIANTGFQDSSSTLISIGWGDKTFYMNTPTWADLSIRTILTVPFGLGPSAIHATYYQQLLEDRPTIGLKLTAKQYRKLVRYIEQTLARNAQGNTKYIRATMPGVVSGNDAYYAAKGRYSLFFTCNSWVNLGLIKCKQKACYWTAFAGGIFYQYGK